MRIRSPAIFLAVAALGTSALVLSTGAAASQLPVIPGHRTELAHVLPGAHPAGTIVTDNWSGYAASGRLFRAVSAVYEVPSVNCAATPSAFAYQWVGLDGLTSTTVEQDGVASYCNSGTPGYFAWSEFYPADVVVQFTLNPGDAVVSSVTYNLGTCTLRLSDLTSGQSFSRPGSCSHDARNSAEVISEGYPATSFGYDGTADYGLENYTGISITDGLGQVGGFTSTNWTSNKVINQGASGVDEAPGSLYGGAAFYSQWFRED